MRSSRWLLILILALGSWGAVAMAAPLSVPYASVNPAMAYAGNPVTVQFMIQSNLQTELAPGEYAYWVEVISNESTPFTTMAVPGDAPLSAGAAVPFFLDLRLPPDWAAGPRTVRVWAKPAAGEAAPGLPVRLEIQPRPESAGNGLTAGSPGPGRIQFGGSVTLSERLSTATGRVNRPALSADIFGRRGDRSVGLAANIGQGWDRASLRYQGKGLQAQAGDINPAWNCLALSGITPRGAAVDWEHGPASVQLLGGRLSSSSNSSLIRLLGGGRIKARPWRGLTLGGAYVYGGDLTSLAGLGLMGQSDNNHSVAGDVLWQITPRIRISSQGGWARTTEATTQIRSGSALHVNAEGDWDAWAGGLSLFRFGPGFHAWGNPGQVTDRQGGQARAAWRPLDLLETRLAYLAYNSNLGNDPTQITALVQQVSPGVSLQSEVLPQISLDYRWERSLGLSGPWPLRQQNHYLMLFVNQGLMQVDWSLVGNLTYFQDETRQNDDLFSLLGSTSLAWRNSWATMDAGLSVSQVRNLGTAEDYPLPSDTLSLSGNLGVRAQVQPLKTILAARAAYAGSWLDRAGQYRTLSLGADATYMPVSWLDFVLGYEGIFSSAATSAGPEHVAVVRAVFKL